MATVITFPGTPIRKGRRGGLPFKDRLRLLLSSLANRLGLPAILQPIEFVDDVTGQRMRIHCGSLFTVISVEDRDYYFRRFSGKFDGTGYSLRIGCYPIR